MEIKEEILEEVEELIQSPNFKEIHDILKNGSYYIEVNIRKTLSDENWEEFPNELSIGYIFEEQFVNNREKLFSLRKNVASYYNDLNVVKRDIKTIYGIFYQMGKAGNLNAIYEKLMKYSNIETNEFQNSGKDFFIAYRLSFSMFNVNVFEIDENYLNFDDAEKSSTKYYEDKEPYLENLQTGYSKYSGKFVDITQQIWFANLSVAAKDLINAGTNLLKIYNSGHSNHGSSLEIDYSSLLLPFIKATEIEIPIFFNKHKTKIIKIAQKLKEILPQYRKILDECEYKALTEFVSQILSDEITDTHMIVKKFKENLFEFRKILDQHELQTLNEFNENIIERKKPNSISFLYYLLKYYELESEINFEDIQVGFLPKTLHDYLLKQKDFVRCIGELGKSRNKHIHQILMLGEISFANYYNYLVQTLQLMSILNHKNEN